MLDKLFGKKSPTQSQSIGNITTNGGQVQVAQAGGDVAQAMSGENVGDRALGGFGGGIVGLVAPQDLSKVEWQNRQSRL